MLFVNGVYCLSNFKPIYTLLIDIDNIISKQSPKTHEQLRLINIENRYCIYCDKIPVHPGPDPRLVRSRVLNNSPQIAKKLEIFKLYINFCLFLFCFQVSLVVVINFLKKVSNVSTDPISLFGRRKKHEDP